MPIPSPFHPRTSALCESWQWKDWAGYAAVCRYGVSHEAEYFALRHAAALLDVSPLFKYAIRGPEAGQFLAWVMARNISRLKVGRVVYGCWADPKGRLMDDGTVTRLTEDHFRLTAAEPSLHWFLQQSRGFDVTIEDVTEKIAALSLQGPNAKEILRELMGDSIDELRFFGHTRAVLGGVKVDLTRTGYTGDLGYEIWADAGDAVPLWDALMEAGVDKYHLRPMGLDALDTARIEAGFIMAGVDYRSAHHCMTPRQASTPYEAGLGWTVKLDREPFIGQAALRREAAAGSAWATVGLEIDRVALERAWSSFDLPPSLSPVACRDAKPLFEGSKQVGFITSSVWSPILKRYIALATVPANLDQPGKILEVEMTLEYWQRRIPATIVERPFFNPLRKRS